MKNTTKLALGLFTALALAATAQAADDIKANNTTALNLAGSWVDNTVPTIANGDVATWDSTVAAANTVAIGGNLDVRGIKVTTPGGAVVVTHAAGNTLTLGSAGIDMSAATQNLTLLNTTNTAADVAISADQTWNVASGRTLQLWSNSNSANQRLTGSGNIQVTGGGLVRMLVGDAGSTTFAAGNANDTYTGNWTITGGSKVISLRNGTHAWGKGTITLDNGTMSQEQGNWNFNNNITIAAGGGTIYSDSFGNNRYMNLPGVIAGNGALTFGAVAAMTGNEGFILTGANTFTGSMTINANATVRIGGDATTSAYSTGAGTLGSIDSSVAITNNGILGFGWTDEHTVANAISGNGIVRLGRTDGTLPSTQVVTLSGNSTYTGATQVNAGRLNLTGTLTSAITVASGARISGTGSTTGLLTLSSGGGIALAGGTTTGSITVNGATFSGANQVTFLTAPVASTVYDVFTYGSGTVTTPGNLTAPYRGTLADVPASQKYTFTAGEYGATRTWNTTTGTWDVATTANWAEGDYLFYSADNVVFGDRGSDSVVTLTGTLLPGSVTVGNSANKYTFQTGAIGGTSSLVKNNAGTLEITSVQTYTGGTTVNGGTLRLSASSGGTGTIRGTLTANAGSTIEVGGVDVFGYNGGAVGLNTINLTGATLVQTQNRNETNAAVINMAGGSTISATGGTSALFDMFGGTAALNASGDATNTISSPVRLRQNDTTFTVADGAQTTDLLISGVISKGGEGNGALIKAGAGTMVLSGNNTYMGNTTINDGTLELTSTGKMYNGGYQGAAIVTINTGGTWKMPDYSYGGVGQLSDYAARRVLSGGVIEVTGGTHSSGQDFTVDADGGTFRYNPANTSNTLTLSGTSNDNIKLNGALTFDTLGNITVSETIVTDSGTGSITKTGTGTLTLSGSNTFAGAVQVNAGTLTLGSGSALGTNAAGTTIASGATLNVNGQTIADGETITAAGTGVAGYAITGSGTIQGDLILTADTTIGGASGDLQIGTSTTPRTITGAYTLTKDGANRVWYRGPSDGTGNTLSAVVINGGTFGIEANNNALNAVPVTVNSNGILSSWGTGSAPTSQNNPITLNGGTLGSDLNGQSYTGAVTLTADSTLGASTSAASFTITGAIGETGGSHGLTKTEGGTVTLTAASTYTGATEVSEGRLVMGDASGDTFATSGVTVASGAIMGGSGTISGGTVSVSGGGMHAPGNSIGLETVNNVTYNPSSIFEWEMSYAGTTVRGTDYDAVNVTGNLNGNRVPVTDR